MRIAVFVGSTLPDELGPLGYAITRVDSGQRMIPHAITEAIADAHCWMPPERIVEHAGIIQTAVYALTVRRGDDERARRNLTPAVDDW